MYKDQVYCAYTYEQVKLCVELCHLVRCYAADMFSALHAFRLSSAIVVGIGEIWPAELSCA